MYIFVYAVDLLSGFLWKGIGSVCKVLFILFIAIQFQEGEYYKYSLVLTYALLISRLGSFGLENQLPLILKRNPDRIYLFSGIITAVSTAIFLIVVNILGKYAGFLSVSLFCSFVLNGAFRFYYPKFYEFVTNIPWIINIIFLFLSLLFHGRLTAEIALFTLASSFFFVSAWQIKELSEVGFLDRRIISKFSDTVRELTRLISYEFDSCISKLAAAFLLVLIWRLPLFINEIIGGSKDDSLALTITIGEAVWQIFMVIVNRDYSQRCINRNASSVFTPSILIGLLGIFCFAIYYLLVILWPALIKNLPVSMLDIASIITFSSAFSWFLLARNILWANCENEIIFLVLNSLLVLGLALVFQYSRCNIGFMIGALWTVCLALVGFWSFSKLETSI